MTLHIRHRTLYRYRRAVAFRPHRLLLMPRSTHDLRILATALAIEPAAQVDWAQDMFGNLVATAIVTDTSDTLAISAELTVEQDAAPWPIFRIAPEAHAFPFRYADAERAGLGPFLAPNHVAESEELALWTRAFVHETPTDTLSLLKTINGAIGSAVAYRIRDEEGTQSPLETLARASGSCRDMAALFIDAVRLLGFGARAVSGYLHDPDAPAEGGGSTHAWAEVYLPGAGWIAFDPTHGRVGSANLVPVATGRCTAEIMPVSGGYVGAPEDFVAMEIDVDIERL